MGAPDTTLLVAGITLLATEIAKGTGSEAGKELWNRVKNAMGWQTDPPLGVVRSEAAARIEADPIVRAGIEALKSEIGTFAETVQPHSTGTIFQQVSADKIVNVSGDMNVINFSMGD